MIHKSVFFCLFFWSARGVCGVSDEVKSVSVMEGHSVTLHTDLTHIQTRDHILWTFKQRLNLAEIIKRDQMDFFFVSKTGIFKDHLQMNNQTGSLTITNIRADHSGLYKLQISRDNISYMSFNVTVYAHLSVPVIIRNSLHCSSSSISSCMLLCSVLNVSHVTLSWYNGSDLHSSISVSDLNIRLSLPLEVEYQDTNTYSCVLNNTITNHTTHLNINQLCQCSEHFQRSHFILASLAVMFLVLVLVMVTTCVSYCYCNNRKQPVKQVQTQKKELVYTEPVCFKSFQNVDVVEADHTQYSSILI